MEHFITYDPSGHSNSIVLSCDDLRRCEPNTQSSSIDSGADERGYLGSMKRIGHQSQLNYCTYASVPRVSEDCTPLVIIHLDEDCSAADPAHLAALGRWQSHLVAVPLHHHSAQLVAFLLLAHCCPSPHRIPFLVPPPLVCDSSAQVLILTLHHISLSSSISSVRK